MASEGRSEKGAFPGQEDGNDQGEGRENATENKVKERKKQCCLSHHVDVSGNGAQVDHHSAPSTAWQDDVNAQVGKAWQMFSFCHKLFAGPRA